jgi:hypothetical protein
VVGVQSHTDLQKVLDAAGASLIEKAFGKIGQVALFSHSGGDGPVFHDNATGKPYQLTAADLAGIKVNWSSTASCTLYGCNTANRFAQKFADAQGVPTFGYDKYAYFSASSKKMDPGLGVKGKDDQPQMR